MGGGQQIRWDAGADGNSPDEREWTAFSANVSLTLRPVGVSDAAGGKPWSYVLSVALMLEPAFFKERFMRQSQSLLSRFGSSSAERVDKALRAVRQGGGVLVVDDEDRENEGDVIFPAASLTVEQMALLIRECSGIVCLCLSDAHIARLGLPMMVEHNTNRQQTAFTVSVEAAEGVTTGVSAADRVTTIKAAVGSAAGPDSLRRPGHVFPLRARPGGVLERRGHTEATVDLMRLAGLEPCGVLCELTNADGTMARLPEVVAFAEHHNMPVMSVEDLASYRQAREQ